mmetsp:Transcript_2483/g.4942  ORF Transcript_2483/g.4942 Transcript_2483/m.4942 type:complete len:335 (+) Transcript_2483:24-1028(+)
METVVWAGSAVADAVEEAGLGHGESCSLQELLGGDTEPSHPSLVRDPSPDGIGVPLFWLGMAVLGGAWARGYRRLALVGGGATLSVAMAASLSGRAREALLAWLRHLGSRLDAVVVDSRSARRIDTWTAGAKKDLEEELGQAAARVGCVASRVSPSKEIRVNEQWPRSLSWTHALRQALGFSRACWAAAKLQRKLEALISAQEQVAIMRKCKVNPVYSVETLWALAVLSSGRPDALHVFVSGTRAGTEQQPSPSVGAAPELTGKGGEDCAEQGEAPAEAQPEDAGVVRVLCATGVMEVMRCRVAEEAEPSMAHRGELLAELQVALSRRVGSEAQ